MSESNQENVTETKSTNGMNTERREVLKGLATIPVVGVFFYNLWGKLRIDEMKRNSIAVFAITDHHVIDIDRYNDLKELGNR